ncbi:hypothetical protein [uncultured Roseivirga sp.]|uniref:leucine-rich repeat domain-containing protein n=1 Tax=uncultured Roseivirga sp. TaxID=543088 RepID=UPI000D7AF6FE|nr:hypothetical protein [uncultured Roseivirga sp.]PWL31743.1 MAG: hypothetical protein DCO95_00735 [Roseivirga sp. XM-24bin3]
MKAHVLIIFFSAILFSCKEEKKLLSDSELEQVQVFTLDEVNKKDGKEIYKVDFSGEGNEEVLSSISDLSQIQYLDLSNNNLRSIPTEVFQLDNLQHLILSGNNIQSIDSKLLELKNLKEVVITDLNQNSSFQDLTVLEVALAMKELGEIEEYNYLKDAPNLLLPAYQYYANTCDRDVPPYLYSKHVYGYISNTATGVSSIVAASSINPDMNLKNAQLNINMAFLRAYDYPGKGEHNAFFGFHGSTIGTSTVKTNTEYNYNRNFEVNEDDEASLRSVPVFNGLFVGKDGVLFKCKVINVSNKRDDRISEIFQGVSSGLEIIKITETNPAVGMVGELAGTALKILQSGRKNVTIHDVELGLHFNDNGVDLQLRKGTYVVLNVPPCMNGVPFQFNWNEYKFDKTNGRFTDDKGNPKNLKFNYIVFTIS